MANILEKAKSILAGNLNSGLSYLITTVSKIEVCLKYYLDKNSQKQPLWAGRKKNLRLFCRTKLREYVFSSLELNKNGVRLKETILLYIAPKNLYPKIIFFSHLKTDFCVDRLSKFKKQNMCSRYFCRQ